MQNWHWINYLLKAKIFQTYDPLITLKFQNYSMSKIVIRHLLLIILFNFTKTVWRVHNTNLPIFSNFQKPKRKKKKKSKDSNLGVTYSEELFTEIFPQTPKWGVKTLCVLRVIPRLNVVNTHV